MAFDTRVLLIAGDRGPNASTVPELLRDLPQARAVRLHDYADAACAAAAEPTALRRTAQWD